MAERSLFLTGHLAEPRLRRVLAEAAAVAEPWEVCNLGIQVAALMTADLIRRRVAPKLDTWHAQMPSVNVGVVLGRSAIT